MVSDAEVTAQTRMLSEWSWVERVLIVGGKLAPAALHSQIRGTLRLCQPAVLDRTGVRTCPSVKNSDLELQQRQEADSGCTNTPRGNEHQLRPYQRLGLTTLTSAHPGSQSFFSFQLSARRGEIGGKAGRGKALRDLGCELYVFAPTFSRNVHPQTIRSCISSSMTPHMS